MIRGNPFLKLIIFCLSIFMSEQTHAQLYIGISANIGNRLNFDPESSGLLNPMTISGNLSIIRHDELKHDWVLQSGLDLGVLGYNLKINGIDTLGPSAISSFRDYSTFYTSLTVSIGKEFQFYKKRMSAVVGGGATLYYHFYNYVSTTIGFIEDNNLDNTVFFAVLESDQYNVAGFLKIAIQLEVSKSIILGLGYSHHFEPVKTGYYEFYHTPEPSSGKISLSQREINLFMLYNISKRR